MTDKHKQAVAEVRAQHPGLPEPGPYGVWGLEDGESYWLPQPSGGHMTLKMTPDTFPANHYMAAVQVVEEGGGALCGSRRRRAVPVGGPGRVPATEAVVHAEGAAGVGRAHCAVA